MMGMIGGYLLRLFIGGTVAFAVMAIAGKGGASEVVRLCCACFMIILILTPGISAGEVIADLSENISMTEAELEDIVNDGTLAVYDKINHEMEARLTMLIFGPDGEGEVKIEYIIDDSFGYKPISARIMGLDYDKARAIQVIRDETGLDGDNITAEG